MIKSSFYSLILIVFVTSCASKKDVYYFQEIDSTAAENSFKFLNIQPGDILDIQIKALNPESVLVFQRQATLGPTTAASTRPCHRWVSGRGGRQHQPSYCWRHRYHQSKHSKP
jgi:hypothetical protein